MSNWETDKSPIGPSSDRLLRLMVVHGTPAEHYSLEELVHIEDALEPPVAVRVAPLLKGWEMQVGA